jgi:hypothetical protein
VQNVQKEQEYITKLQNSAEKETMYKKVSRQSRELLQSSLSLYKNGKTQKSESCAPLQIHIRTFSTARAQNFQGPVSFTYLAPNVHGSVCEYANEQTRAEVIQLWISFSTVQISKKE